MRNLTIKREKRFVACLGQMKIYIEDPEAGDLTINGVLCRKLGVLKNGEEKTFPIGTGAARVFAIGDKVSRGYSNDCYPIPAGEEDVFLSGKNVFSLSTGNPFRFDGVTDETILSNRKKGSRIGIIVLVVAGIVGAIAGFVIGRSAVRSHVEPKDFSVDGMTITLTDEFESFEEEAFTATYGSQDIAVFILKEPFTLMDGLEEYSLADYGNLVIQNNSTSAGAVLQQSEDLTWFEYKFTNPDVGYPYVYYSVVYKSTDAFWLVQFVTPEKQIDEYAPLFIQWANSVTFS